MTSLHMKGSVLNLDFTDKRRADALGADPDTKVSITVFDDATADAIFVANAGGTTTTLVGANGDPATGDNVVRIGEEFKLTDSAGDLKEDTVFTVDSVSVDDPGAGDTTVTFSPAAEVATASGDEARLAETIRLMDEASIDSILQEVDSAYFTDSQLEILTTNDKVMELRERLDPGGI